MLSKEGLNTIIDTVSFFNSDLYLLIFFYFSGTAKTSSLIFIKT